MSTDNKVADAIRSRTWAEILTEEYDAGADDIEVMAALRLSRKQFDLKYNTEPVFKELVDVGRLRSAAWWRGIARKNLLNRNLNTPAWSFVMKNRFGWTEKTEAINIDTPSKQFTDDELRQQIASRLPAIAKQFGAIKKDSETALFENKDATE